MKIEKPAVGRPLLGPTKIISIQITYTEVVFSLESGFEKTVFKLKLVLVLHWEYKHSACNKVFFNLNFSNTERW